MTEDGDESFAAGIALFVFGSILLLLIAGVILGLWDLHRFGRKGAPWSVAVSYAALFSSFGFWRFGPLGMLFGLACICAFERGRWQWRLRLNAEDAP